MELQEMESLSNNNIEDVRKKLGSQLNKTLIIDNIPYHFETDDLKTLLKECG
jgi:uncharacterized protein YnzC (UPF0291/DUF896 family)